MKTYLFKLLAFVFVIILAGCQSIPSEDAVTSSGDEITSSSPSYEHSEELQTNLETTDTELSTQDNPDSESVEVEAAYDKGIYIKYRDDYYVFGHVAEDGTPLPDKGVFYASVPEGQLYDINGRQITREALKPGNLVIISGDLFYEDSYPGVCCNITQMRVLRQGTAGDAALFGKMLNIKFLSPPPSEQPLLQVKIMEDGLEYFYVDFPKYGYEWTWENEDGTASSSNADSPHVLDIKDLTEVDAKDGKPLTLHFTKAPDSVKVICWPLGTPSSKADQGTQVQGSLNGKNYTLEDLPADCVYQITGIWESGYVNYGFVLKSDTP